MLRCLSDANRAFDKPEYLEFALKNADFLTKNLINEEGRLLRVFKNSDAQGAAFLDDYANVADAFIALYEVTFDESWLHQSKKLTDYANTHNFDENNGIFFY